jgi:hypothetical protein
MGITRIGVAWTSLSARMPNPPQIVGDALKSPGGVDELGEIGARAPVEVELGAYCRAIGNDRRSECRSTPSLASC